ncbi:MAG: hypothetical protein ACKPEY_00530, partial [Planctomycetota bacterium]
SEKCRRLRSFGSFGSFMKRAPRSYANSGAREFQFHAGQDTFINKSAKQWQSQCHPYCFE